MDIWISSENENRGKNILMLDLEQVLIVDSGLLLNRDFWKYEDKELYYKHCLLRPHSKYFVKEISRIFDKIYLNTGVSEAKAKRIMKKYYHVYFDYYVSGSNLKSFGYEKFLNDVRLFHLEDSILSENLKEDAENMKRLGVNIIDVEPYNFYNSKDKDLLVVLEKLEKMLLKK